MSEFKVGDKIAYVNGYITVVAVDERHKAWVGFDQGGIPYCSTDIGNWELWVEQPVVKQWIVTTEWRNPCHLEHYITEGTADGRPMLLKANGDHLEANGEENVVTSVSPMGPEVSL